MSLQWIAIVLGVLATAGGIIGIVKPEQVKRFAEVFPRSVVPAWVLTGICCILGAKFALEYNRGGTAWVSFAYEPGRREYNAFLPASLTDDISLFSNYTYNRVSLFTNFRIVDGLSFSGFLAYQPEDHVRESDDATATLLSVRLIYMF